MKTFCISHVKDVDGISAAALVRAATGADFILSDYDNLMENLAKVPRDADAVVLCDLGADNSDFARFAGALKDLAKRAEVTYVDHHFMSADKRAKLRRNGVKLVHDEKECASMLAYLTFRESLPEGARLLALCGAVTDYMDDSPTARGLMEKADRQFVLLEATMLAYALARKGKDEGFAETLVTELSRMRRPHEIGDVPGLAASQLEEVTHLEDEVAKRGTKVGRLAYMVTTEHSTGNVAKLLVGAFDVPVGMAMKEKQQGWYEVSLRSTSECRIHLGKAVDRISAKYGGSGGGHAKAAGCRIPVADAQKMIDELSKKV